MGGSFWGCEQESGEGFRGFVRCASPMRACVRRREPLLNNQVLNNALPYDDNETLTFFTPDVRTWTQESTVRFVPCSRGNSLFYLHVTVAMAAVTSATAHTRGRQYSGKA